MKIRVPSLIALTLTALIGQSNAATLTVNTADVTDFGAGKTNLYFAITNCSAGDTIAFNIPGAGPHYIQVPASGLPLIYQKHNLAIDGYTQPGAKANTNSITSSNSAVLKIVIDGRNGGARVMDYSTFDGTLATSDPPINNTSMSTERTGYGTDELGLIGIYRSTNVTIKGLAFLGDNLTNPNGNVYCIALAHDYGLDTTVKDRLAYDAGSTRNCAVSGCWFGLDPTNMTVDGVVKCAAGIAFFRHREANPPVVPAARPELPNESLIVGVRPGSTNPRADFNVFAGIPYMLAGEAVRTRVAGNFFGVFPDGVTPYDLSALDPTLFSASGALWEIGRYDDTQPLIIGTDGDGVNDADEGNLFGPVSAPNGTAISIYSTSSKLYLVSGNTFGVGIDGRRWTNFGSFMGDIGNNTRVQFGSDFNGVSDALEANRIYNNWPLTNLYGSPPTGDVSPILVLNNNPSSLSWISFRGNELVNNTLTPFVYASSLAPGSKLANFTNYYDGYMDTNGTLIAILSSGSTAADIIGVCATTNGSSYSNIFLDVYTLDPEGWTNGQAFMYDDLNVTNGFPQGKTYLGTFVDNGPADRNPTLGQFNFNAASLGLAAGTQITVTANYSQDPAGTTRGRTHTSNFSNPATLRSPLRITSITRSGSTVTISWTGGSAPYTLQKATSITGPWSNFATGLPGPSTTDTTSGTQAFYRVLGN